MAKAHYETNQITTFSNADSSGIFKYISHIRKGGAIPSTVFFGSTIATSDSERSTIQQLLLHSLYKKLVYIAFLHKNVWEIDYIVINGNYRIKCSQSPDVTWYR